MGINFDRADGAGRVERRADQVHQVVNVAEVDGEATLQRRITAQAASTARASADARSMVDATHHPEHGLAAFKKTPSQAHARLKINGPRLPESRRRIRIR